MLQWAGRKTAVQDPSQHPSPLRELTHSFTGISYLPGCDGTGLDAGAAPTGVAVLKEVTASQMKQTCV